MELNIKKIEAELKRLGWSKTRLGKEMGGMTRQAVNYYFTSGATVMKAEKIAKTLNIDPKDLLI